MRLRHIIVGSAFLALMGAAPALADGNLSATQQSYRAAADKICQASNQTLVDKAKTYEVQDEVSRSGASSKKTKVAKPGDVVKFVTEFASTAMSEQFSKLKALTVPDDDKSAMTKLFAEADKALAVTKAKPQDVAFTDPFKSVGKQFKSLGFTDCGKNASATK